MRLPGRREAEVKGKDAYTVVRKSYHTPLWGHLIKGPQLFHFFELGLENW